MTPKTPKPAYAPHHIVHARATALAIKLILATTSTLWLGATHGQTPAAQVATPAVTELRFQDLFRLPVGPAGLELSDKLLAAHQHTVRMVGYMVQPESPQPGRFMLTPRPLQMSEHADGEADDLPPATVMVSLDPTQQDLIVPHVRGLVEVAGVISVGRFEERDGRISWVRLQLPARSTAPAPIVQPNL